MTEFASWKNQMQQDTLSKYTLDTAQKVIENKITKQYFNCHRSHNYTSKGKNKRQIKSLGTNKMNKVCPSRLEVTMNNHNAVIVKFWKTHYGHAVEIGRLTLDKNIRSEIAGMNVGKKMYNLNIIMGSHVISIF